MVRPRPRPPLSLAPALAVALAPVGRAGARPGHAPTAHRQARTAIARARPDRAPASVTPRLPPPLVVALTPPSPRAPAPPWPQLCFARATTARTDGRLPPAPSHSPSTPASASACRTRPPSPSRLVGHAHGGLAPLHHLWRLAPHHRGLAPLRPWPAPCPAVAARAHAHTPRP
nr:vegetative cell wall protein gp1-like [Aegilops tauschii subsp. strangulata]